VVGAGGFVGRHLCAELEARGQRVAVVSTQPRLSSWGGLRLLEDDPARIEAGLEGVDRIYFVGGVAHGAALAGDATEVLKRVNVEAPQRWLRAADRAQVPRFVWLSSIKVLGDVSRRPLVPEDPYRPGDPYARSKVAAERVLLAERRDTTALAIVRPPLVYGPGVVANFRRLLRWADRPAPLPLAAARAPRSLVSVGNLCDALCRLGELADGGEGVYHVADDEAVSVAELLARLRRMCGRRPHLWPVPRPLLKAGAAATGLGGTYQRLFEPLEVETARLRRELGWAPRQTLDDALQETVTWFRTLR